MQQIINFFNKPLLKIPLIFGAFTGVLVFFYFLALYFLKIPPLGNIRVPDFGIHLIMMVVAVWYYKKNVGKGLLHLWEALTICYVVNSVGALLAGWLIYGFVSQIDTSVFSDYLLQSKNLIIHGKADLVKSIGEAEYQKMLSEVSKTKPSDIISDEFVKKSVMAVLPIVIISLIFRRQDYGVYQKES